MEAFLGEEAAEFQHNSPAADGPGVQFPTPISLGLEAYASLCRAVAQRRPAWLELGIVTEAAEAHQIYILTVDC